MKLPEFWKSQKGILLRYILAAFFLYAAWKVLGIWYTSEHFYYYLIFVALAIAGFLIGDGAFLYTQIKNLPRFRVLVFLPIIVLCFPWGEWLGFGTIFTRESWSEMLFLQSIFIYGCTLVIRAFPEFATLLRSAFTRFVEGIAARRILIWTPPLLLFLLTVSVAFFVNRETPVVQDSAAHLFQAKIFSKFKLFAPQPAVSEAFTGSLDLLVMQNGKWFGMYFPGFAALMAPASWLELEWMVSPLLVALSCSLWIFYARRWHNDKTAILIGWLMLLSPFVIVMSSTVMVFTPELFFASASIVFARLALEKPTAINILALSVALVGGFLVRFFSLIPLLLPILAFASWQGLRKKIIRIPIAITAGILIGILLVCWYQYETTGNPFIPGYKVEVTDLGIGFGEHEMGTHSPLRAIDNVSNNLLGLNYYLGGWLSGSLLFVFAFLLRQKIQLWDKLLLAGCACVMAFYFTRFSQDLFFGPRNYYSFTPILLLFIARNFTEESTESKFRPVILLPFLVITILISVPMNLPTFIKRYDPGRTQAGQLKEQIRKTDGKRTLVFLDKNVSQNFVNWNDPFLKSSVIICRDFGERNKEVEKYFPNYRPVWFRMNMSFEKGQVNNGFMFTDTPYRTPDGTISLFELGMALQAARELPKRDFFDVCYIDLFNAPVAVKYYEFLDNAEKELPSRGAKYKRDFRKGILHAGKMLLLPKIAFEQRGNSWYTVFNPKEFRNEFFQAQNAFINSGDIGKTILEEMDKVRRRIDHNSDGNLSDSEILLFLTEKIKLLSRGGSL